MSELQRIKAGEATVWEGLEVSYGISPILSKFSDLSMLKNRPCWTLFLINVETLIRNRKTYKANEKPDDPKKTAAEVLSDCTVLAQYIAAYCRLTIPPQLKQTAIICFYLPNYATIPKTYLKEKMPAHTEWRWAVLQAVKELLRKQGWTARYEGAEVVFCAPSEKELWPHRGLVKDLTKNFNDLGYRKTLLISHVPVDFMMYKTFKDFTLLESYTGNLKTIKDFGKKVFKEEYFPFNKYTLLLLGDSHYLKSQVERKAKKTVKECAQSRHWNLLPDKQVLSEIQSLAVVPIELLIKPDI